MFCTTGNPRGTPARHLPWPGGSEGRKPPTVTQEPPRFKEGSLLWNSKEGQHPKRSPVSSLGLANHCALQGVRNQLTSGPIQPRPMTQRKPKGVNPIALRGTPLWHNLPILRRHWSHGFHQPMDLCPSHQAPELALHSGDLTAPFLSGLSPLTPWHGGPAPMMIRPTLLNCRAMSS